MLQVIEKIINNYTKVTRCGKGFLLEKPLEKYHPVILHVQGTPHEMGYQHGFLLAGIGIPSLSGIYYRCGGWNPESGETPTSDHFETGRTLLSYASKTYFLNEIKTKALEMKEEIEGMVEGFCTAGVQMTFEDLLNWVSIFELGNEPDLIGILGEEVKNNLRADQNKRCTGIAVWGNATKDGRMIHGANQDIDTFGILHKHSIVVVAKPDEGHSFLGMVWPGMPWSMTGMNEKGISLGEKTSRSPFDNDIRAYPTIPHFMRCRKVLQNADNLEAAIDIMKRLHGGLGWNLLVSDAINKIAADIEVSATRTGVVYPWDSAPPNEQDAVWTTNHYNAFPGFRGYPIDDSNFPNMAALAVDKIALGNTRNWQRYLKENEPSSWNRWERARVMIAEKHGIITVDDVMGFMSDTYGLDHEPPISISRAEPEIRLTTHPVKHLFGPDQILKSQKLASAYSCVFNPDEREVFVAAGAVPAQKGPFYPINLNEHLGIMNDIAH